MPEKHFDSVFVNIPYDKSFIDLYLSYIAGLSALDLLPCITPEMLGGERRLDHIFALLDRCPYSVHELSPVVSARHPKLNMVFELGLIVALHRFQPKHHTWFVFEAQRPRLDRTLSDLAGTDAYIHDGRPSGLFRELSNAFVRLGNRTTVQDMRAVYLGLKQGLPKILKTSGSRSPYTTRAFSELRVLARTLSDQRTAQFVAHTS